MVLAAHREGEAPVVSTRRIGPALVFARLWEELQIPQVIRRLLAGRQLTLPVERILFLPVLHRLFASGSDRSCLRVWKQDQQIPGTETIALHQIYRAMAWLGEPLPEDQQAGATPFSARCTKDAFEEALFDRRRDLFSDLELVFFDTTSIYFEGEGGTELGQYGHSKDHRPDRRQMIVGAVLDGEGRPLCCELWPGNVTDVKTLIPIVDRLRTRFQIRSIRACGTRGRPDGPEDQAAAVLYCVWKPPDASPSPPPGLIALTRGLFGRVFVQSKGHREDCSVSCFWTITPNKEPHDATRPSYALGTRSHQSDALFRRQLRFDRQSAGPSPRNDLT